MGHTHLSAAPEVTRRRGRRQHRQETQRFGRCHRYSANVMQNRRTWLEEALYLEVFSCDEVLKIVFFTNTVC